MTDYLQFCEEQIRKDRRAVVMTGAGVSTAAGIPDFRGPTGLYRQANVDADRLFDIDAFHDDPSYYYRFHRACRNMLRSITPTLTHRFLAAWENHGGLCGIVTQNFDGLHESAGSKNIWPLHGTIATASCLRCRKSFDGQPVDRLLEDHDVPYCSCGGVIKPDIVFFGEAVRHLDHAFHLCSVADFMLVLGTSLLVAPASTLPSLCRCPVVVINRGSTGLSRQQNVTEIDADLDQFFTELNDRLHFLEE